jgi:hypothetical protein
MKKVFLLVGIATFSAASAQQNDLFDIQKHLQKKQAEGKNIGEKMKLLLHPFKKANLYNTYTTNNPTFSHTTPNGDKIITLGQDNMPCVVPDMSLFQAMPNTGYDKNFLNNLWLSTRQPGQIPNGSSPLKMLVSK